MSDSPLARGAAAAALGVSTQAFDLLRDLIGRELGLDFDGARASLLEDKLADVATRHGVRSHLDFYYMLRYDQEREALWAEVADVLAVPETFFWRQPEQILALVRGVVPALLARDPGPVRIWSAACCSGEEPLSIAIALHAEGLALDRFQIRGSDASPRLLDRARRGIYGERSLRRLPEPLRARYFAPVEGGWRIDPAVHRAVEWRRANLVDPAEAAPLARADVVFCRNVFIYFSDEAVRRVVETLETQMPEDATLFLGAAESLARIPTRFQLQEIEGAFVYRKGAEAAAPAAPHRVAG